jgi:pimeloyl-ACP methyl ester carboxylesterase
MSSATPLARRVIARALCGAALALAGAAAQAAPTAQTAGSALELRPCRLPGVEHQAQCGTLKRPLDPAAASGVQIDLHVAVLPALARRKKDDPVFFFAGGPGQSAIELAGPLSRMLARLSNRRDLVLIDQRGTGRSAPLVCAPLPATAPLAESADPERQFARLADCRRALAQLPHGDLRHYSTWVAMQDADAVRRALGAERINLVGGSYGTRAALDYLRQFPQAVRRVVIDGVAPPDMVLPAAFSADNQAALDALLAACERDPLCAGRHPELRRQWRELLAGLPREVVVAHPVTGAPERLTLTRDALLGLVRAPLYAPATAAALPLAIDRAARGQFEPLAGLASSVAGSRTLRLAEGQHFSVVCSEDAPRIGPSTDRPGADFGNSFVALYTRACADWPRGAVPPGFYELPKATAATLVLSGGADPATPARHGERVAQALGSKARHVVVPEAAHGVMALPCMRDVIFRFIDADRDEDALALPADCAAAMPRARVFVPVEAAR